MTHGNHAQVIAANFAPLLLGCGVFLSQRCARGKCVECWATGKSRKTRKGCKCSADTLAPCTAGLHLAPGTKAAPSAPTPFQVFHINESKAYAMGRGRGR